MLGPDSSLAAIIAATIAPLVLGDPARATDLAAGLALISGAFCIAFGVLRLGILTELLSKPIRIGYLNGIALTVFVGQLPKLFGFSVEADGRACRSDRRSSQGVTDGLTNPTALGHRASRRSRSSSPAGAGGRRCRGSSSRPSARPHLTARARSRGQRRRAGRRAAAAGTARFHVPGCRSRRSQAMLAGGVAIAVISMADTSVLSRTFAGRSGQRVDQDQELLALGSASIGAGLFGGFSVSASASRTPVAEQAGAKTQLAGVVGALTIAALLVVAPWLTTNLPQSTLAAIVMTACLSLVDVAGSTRLVAPPADRSSSSRWSCFVGVAVVGRGGRHLHRRRRSSLRLFFWRAWRPHSAILGRVEGVKGYHDVTPVPGGASTRRAHPLPLGCAALLRERGGVPRADRGRDRRSAPRPRDGSSSPPSP